jgi:acetolactate synthase-1/2/3 large subunit/5-guanidino-2-oxopentanoate decarboxylase
MTPMGQAYSDSVPMLVISSCLDEVAAKRGQLHQMLDQEGAAGCVCDWSETARTAEAAYQLIDRAFLEISTQRPRPKHIQVPIAALESRAGKWTEKRAQPRGLDEPNTAIDAAERFLLQAKRPLFIFGGGVRRDDAARKVVRLSGAASFSTYAGRGVIGPDDPLHFGAFLARPDSVTEILKADAVIAVGTSLSEVDLWRTNLGQQAPLMRIDTDPSVLTDQQGASSGFDCDSAAFLIGLAKRLAAKPPAKSDWTADEVALARARWCAETDAERPGIVPICDALREAVPPDTMIYSDMTQIAYVAKEVWDMDRPGHWHHPFGFGTLGYALPAGIGGAVGRKGLPTMVIAGDYGFQYTMQELGVAVELGLPIPIILWDNGKLKEIEDSMVRAQIAPNAVIARNPDFCKLAEAFGAGSAEPGTLVEMQAAVQAAFKADGPTLIRITPDITA